MYHISCTVCICSHYFQTVVLFWLCLRFIVCLKSVQEESMFHVLFPTAHSYADLFEVVNSLVLKAELCYSIWGCPTSLFYILTASLANCQFSYTCSICYCDRIDSDYLTFSSFIIAIVLSPNWKLLKPQIYYLNTFIVPPSFFHCVKVHIT